MTIAEAAALVRRTPGRSLTTTTPTSVTTTPPVTVITKLSTPDIKYNLDGSPIYPNVNDYISYDVYMQAYNKYVAGYYKYHDQPKVVASNNGVDQNGDIISNPTGNSNPSNSNLLGEQLAAAAANLKSSLAADQAAKDTKPNYLLYGGVALLGLILLKAIKK